MLSPSSPLAAETHPSATRSLDSATVLPGETVTVTVDVTVPQPATGNAFSRLTETLPDGFLIMWMIPLVGAGLNRLALSDVANAGCAQFSTCSAWTD